jgi:succinate-semialdehyde dehydrogenase/glutarate-semialdehyde dehydrogenase
MGKPLTEAIDEIKKCAWMTEIYADNVEKWLADEIIDADGLEHRVIYQPLGVILSIMPWNFPFWQVLRFAVPTLLAGNVSILKHASLCTGCSLAIEQLVADAGFPDYTFKSIITDHAIINRLIASDAINGVSFTGSIEAGANVAEQAGRHLKKAVLELGGSDPFIVLDDVDINVVAMAAVKGRMINTGQSCIAAKRFIVDNAIIDAFTEKICGLMSELIVGDPLDEKTMVGPLANKKALDQMVAFVNDAQKKGAQILTGGHPMDKKGYFFEPTVLTDVTQEMMVAKQEVFGPIAPLFTVKDEKEAVTLANATDFGLGGSIWTKDIERGARIARSVESGCLFVNHITKSDPRMPFGGVKKSGIGRELSIFGIREFVNVKGLNVYKHHK